MRFVVAGGGTGGHVYPALAVADALRAGGDEVLYLGTERGMESRLAPAAGLRFEAVPAAPFPTGLGTLLRLPAALWRTAAGARAAAAVLRRFGPDAVLGVGGYASAPAAIAARRLGIPLVLHEQNVLPGRANRLLARSAAAVALSWEASRRWIDGPKVRVTGNPVRRDVRDADRAAARRARGLAEDRLLLVVVGGSRGARRLNAAVPDLALRLAAEGRPVSILWSTGRDLHEESRAAAAGIPDLEVVPYIDAMADALAAADVLIARAGASTLAEAAARGLPAVLVPYPHASGGHQRRNAEVFEAAGAARIVDDAACDGASLHAALRPWLEDAAARRGAGTAAFGFARPRAAEEIADLVREVAAARRGVPAEGSARRPAAGPPAANIPYRRAARRAVRLPWRGL